MPYHDKSSPDDIYAFFGMSKKAFKMNVGILYKSKLISLEDGGIRLAPEDLIKPESAEKTETIEKPKHFIQPGSLNTSSVNEDDDVQD